MSHQPETPVCKVVFCWPGVPGYMGACWRALAARSDVELHVISREPARHETSPAPFDFQALSKGFSVELISRADLHNSETLARHVIAQQPNVVVTPGWRNHAALQLTHHPALTHTRFVLGMDTPWRDTWRQRLGLGYVRPLIRRFDAAVVPGERAWQYARRLGFAHMQICRGLYGIDYPRLAAALEQRKRADTWPRRFLYIGRYVRDKAVDVLLDGYAAYRRRVREPWPLTTCGRGPLAKRIQQADGVTDQGFVQPDDLINVMAEHGALVLPSRFEPWGVAVAEACAAGLPVLCSESCGSAVELVRPFHNGRTFASDDAEALTRMMCWMHDHADRLPQMGRAGQPLAAAYDAERWAERWADLFAQLHPRA